MSFHLNFEILWLHM